MKESHSNMIKLFKEGENGAEIGRLTGYSRERVRQVLKKAGYQFPKQVRETFKCKKCKRIKLVSVRSVVKGVGQICGKCQRSMWAVVANVDCCINCGTTKIKHQGNGWCQLCYCNNRYHTDSEFRKRQLQATLKNYKANRPKRLASMRIYSKKYKALQRLKKSLAN